MKKIVLILFSFSLLFLVGCLPIAMENVSLTFDSSNIELEEGKTYQLLPRVAGLSNFQISYSDYDEAILTVSTTGEVVALKEGVTSIKATLVGQNISVIVVVTVIPASSTGGGDGNNEKDYSIVVEGGLKDYQVGETAQLQFKENNEDYDGAVTWISTNPNVVTVSSTGLILAVSGGSSSITAIYGNKTVTVNITVAGGGDPIITPIITALTISGDFILDVGEISQLTVTPDVNLDFDVTWSSEDTEVATVDINGKVIGVAAGIVNIVATLKADPTIYAKCTMVVRDTSSSETVVTGITLSGTTEVLARSKIKLTHEFTPSEATGAVLYSSENQTIATVDQNGWVTGVAGGSVKITVTLVNNPNIFDSVSVKVIGMPSSIGITGNTTITVNGTAQLTATVNPITASQAVSWTSSNTSVAIVSATGLVTAKATGTAVITATSLASNQVTGSFAITVVSAPTITISDGAASIVKGQTKTLTATVLNLTNTAVNWTSSNTSVATVDSSGKVTAVAIGTATITATSAANGSLKANCLVTVVNAPAITISDATASIIKGQTKTLTATVSNLTNTAVTWTSSNTSVATVSSSGVVTAVAAGNATITATSVANTALKATCAVTVTAAPSGSLTITQSPTGTIAVGASGYQIYVNDSSGASISRLECTFSSSNSSVATVSSYGTISALANGTATITVTHPSKGTGSIVLTIGSGGGTTPPPAGTLTITQSPTGTIPVGASGYQLYVKDSSGNDVSRLECTFSSSNSSIATVSSYGTISALATGSATITVTHPSKGRGTIILTVGSSGSGGVVHYGAVFSWIEQYLVTRTLSRNVYTYGNVRKTERTLGSVSYFWPGTNTINKEYYGRYHNAMTKVWYVVIHHTGNNNLGADARMTARYCSTADVSIHYCVDAKSVYSGVKESSVAWHAGDGMRPAGSTYYNSTYGATCITGGGSNGIGIEMTQDQGNDLFMTWHRTAKLTADILARYSLPTSRVKQHNHFSGKNCPQELRESGLYTEVFAKMVKAEYQYRTLYNTFTITFSSGNTSIINNYGHVISKPASDTVVSYTIKVSKAGITESKTYRVTVPGTVGAAVSGKRDRSEIVL